MRAAEMTPDAGPSLFDILWTGLLAAVGVAVGLIKRAMGSVERKAEAALPREEFKEQIARRDQQYENLRKDIKELFGRDDKIKDTIHAEGKAIRAEMTEYFNRLSEQIRGMSK